MKFENKIVLIIVISIAIYASFLFLSDYNSISDNVSQFQVEYSIPILLLIIASWVPLFCKWHFLFKKNGIKIPLKTSILIWLSGSAFQVTPGHIGELMKSQLLKNIFNIPRSKTTPIVFVDKFYDLVSALIVSIIGIIILDIDFRLAIVSAIILGVLLFLIYCRPVFEYFLKKITKFKFFSKFSENITESYEILKNSTNYKIASISILLSVSYWTIIASSVYLILLAFDITSISFMQAIATYPVSILIGVASFIPGGVGVTEGSLAGLFALQGLDISLALVVSIFIRIFTLWFSVAIGFIGLKLSGGLSLSREFKN